MNKNAIITEIMDIIYEIAGIEEDDMSPQSAVVDDLDMNSLEILTMISNLERKHQIRFATKDLRTIITIEDIAEYILSKSTE